MRLLNFAIILVVSVTLLACASASKSSAQEEKLSELPAPTESKNIKNTTKETQENLKERDKVASQTDFAEGWISTDRAQALYSTTKDAFKEETDIPLARERLAWLLLLEHYNLQREDRGIATRLANSNFFQQLGTEKVEKTIKGDRVAILLSKSKPNLKAEWEAALVNVENRFPELKNRRKSN